MLECDGQSAQNDVVEVSDRRIFDQSKQSIDVVQLHLYADFEMPLRDKEDAEAMVPSAVGGTQYNQVVSLVLAPERQDVSAAS